jgi:ATP-dependent DNA helicase RecG
MVKSKALKSAVVKDSKVPNRQNGGLDDGLKETISSKLINVIRINPHITQKDLAMEIDVPLRTIERTMKELQENGKIERKGGRRYAYWEIID